MTGVQTCALPIYSARAEIETLIGEARQEEIARMLSGAEITDEARAAAQSLIASDPA